jgi:hypothetical protein
VGLKAHASTVVLEFASGAKALEKKKTLIAALKRCATQNPMRARGCARLHKKALAPGFFSGSQFF